MGYPHLDFSDVHLVYSTNQCILSALPVRRFQYAYSRHTSLVSYATCHSFLRDDWFHLDFQGRLDMRAATKNARTPTQVSADPIGDSIIWQLV